MDVGDALRNLADLVDAIDETGAAVTDATPRTVTEDGRCIATLTIELPAGTELATATTPDSSPTSATGPDGSTGPTRRPISHHQVPGPVGPAHAKLDHRSGPTQAPQAGTETGSTGAEPSADVEPNAVDDAPDSPDAVPDDPDEVDGDSPADGQSEAETTPDESDRAAADSSAAESTATDVGDDEVPCTNPDCPDVFDSEHGMRIHRSKAHTEAGPVANPERLRTVYEREDSFEQMRDALDVDVSAQTVRRWMMSAGLHSVDNGAADDQGDADNEAEAATDSEPGAGSSRPDPRGASEEPDGQPTDAPASERESLPAVDAALPDGVTATRLRSAVEDASTLYDVQQRLDLDRETAREVLSAYDLLELVHGRVADRHRREELKAEIDDRLRANVTPADSPSD